jgi:N-methylhydantoinase A
LVSHSGGGLMTVSSAWERPARICQSGRPRECGRSQRGRLGLPNAISLDMGGTSADIAAITAASPHFAASRVGFNIDPLPAIDLVTIGAGGGTIAWIDEAGALQSGPRARCRPGAGLLRPWRHRADEHRRQPRARPPARRRLPRRPHALDRYAAERAIADRIASPLGMTVEEAAAETAVVQQRDAQRDPPDDPARLRPASSP